MGRARIDAALGEGRYRIVRVPDESFVTNERERVEAIIAQANENRLALSTQISDQEDAKANVIAQMDALLAELAPAVDDETRAPILAEYARLARQVGEIAGKISELQWQDAKAVASIAAAQKRLTMFARGEPTPEAAWCADYTVELAQNTEVSIIAPNDEEQSGRELVVMPQQSPYRPGGWLPAEDGYLQPREWMTEAQAYFNAAVLPGVQRHRPRFRVATINSIDDENDTCSLTLVPAASSAQDLPINANPNLDTVPIVYMACNAAAFEEGDRVVVDFVNRDWNAPVVIGFESDPRPCEGTGEGGYVMVPADDNAPSGWPGVVNSSPRHFAGNGYGEDPGLFGITPDSRLRAGPHFWRGSGGRIISYNHGGIGRYGFARRDTRLMGVNEIFMLGARIGTGRDPASWDASQFTVTRGVVGACILNDALVVIVRLSYHPTDGACDRLLYIKNPWPDLAAAFDPHNPDFDPQAVADQLGLGGELGPDWLESSSNPITDSSWTRTRPWTFSPDGTKGAAITYSGTSSTSHDYIQRLELSGGFLDQRSGNLIPVSFTYSREQLTTTTPDTRLKYEQVSQSLTGSVGEASWDMAPGWSEDLGYVNESAMQNGFITTEWGVFDETERTIQEVQDCATSNNGTVIDTAGRPDPPAAYYDESLGPLAWTARYTDSKTCAVLQQDGRYSGLQAWVKSQLRVCQYWRRMNYRRRVSTLTYTGFRALGVEYDAAGTEMIVKLQPSQRSLDNPARIHWVRRVWYHALTRVRQESRNPGSSILLQWHLEYYDVIPNLDAPWVVSPNNTAVSGFNPGWGELIVRDDVLGLIAGHAELEITVGGVPVPGTRAGISETDFVAGGYDDPDHPELATAGVVFSGAQTSTVLDVGHYWDDSFNVWETDYTWSGLSEKDQGVPLVKVFPAIMDVDAGLGCVVAARKEIRQTIKDWTTVTSGVGDLKVLSEIRDGYGAVVRGEEVALPDAGYGPYATQALPTGYNGEDWLEINNVVTNIVTQMHWHTEYITGMQTIGATVTGTNSGWMMNDDFLANVLWAKDSQSAVISFALTADTSTRALEAEIGGVDYDLETLLDVPTKVNLRVVGVGPV